LIQDRTPPVPRGHQRARAHPRPRPQDPLLQAFDRLRKLRPLAPLVLSASGSRRATVAGVDSLALAARRCLEAGDGALAPGAMVAVAAPNGPGVLASLIALRRAGLAALLLDGQAPQTEVLRAALALGASALLRCAAAWPEGAADWQSTRLAAAGTPAAVLLPGIAVVKLTSGSTGAPRGIATPAEALLADDAALARTMGLTADDCLVAALPMSHSYGLSSLVLPALVRGTPLVMPEETGLFGPFVAAERIGATVLPTVPAYLDALLRLSQAPSRPPALRLVITAGAQLAARTAAGFREVYGLPVHVFYGASECGGICYDREGGAAERGTVGSPVDGVRIDLLPAPPAPRDNGDAGGASGRGTAGDGTDARSTAGRGTAGGGTGGRNTSGGGTGTGGGGATDQGPGADDPGAAAAGHCGTVVVSSAAVAAGYLPELDARLSGGRFVAGDMGSWRHGELVLMGRQDGVVNIKGKKVNPHEVESVLGELAGVEEAVVLGVPVPEIGGEVLRAVIACRPGRLTRETVLAWCRDRLAAHKVPRSLILLQEIPRNARGKPDRPALLALGAGSVAAAAGCTGDVDGCGLQPGGPAHRRGNPP
jgi:acyl-CoA synthetase (AMP-forming)/AMP-acid ligase II